ncbi:MAG: ATP-binding cassette domain-containing protein [Vicinamibacterales bacterium]
MIAFDDVSFARGAAPVLRSVSFAVEPGGTLALVGRSGAGKSTVLKLINRMLVPASGRVIVDGRDTGAWDPIALRRQTGYVLQEVGLFPHMSVRRNVAAVPMLLGWEQGRIDDRVDALLELVGLPPADYGDRWPDQLSGGQRQRVGVARALAAAPPIVLMDEPFGALDPITRRELHHEFRRIRAQVQTTIVLVTHDMSEALALADRVGVLEGGRLAAIGNAEELRHSSEPAVRAILDGACA